MQLDPRTVLVPVDLQQAFDAAPWPRRNNPELDTKVAALLRAWRASGRPIIHVRHDSVMPESTLRPGEPGNAFRPAAVPLAGEPVVPKSVNCAFIGTDLDLQLRRLQATSIVTFGVSTDMCVSTTVRVAANLGYRTIIVEDCCACFDLTGRDGTTIPAETIHAAHLATLGFEFCEVADAARIEAALA